MKNLKSFEQFVESINKEREIIINEIADWDTPKVKKDKNTVSCDDDEKYEREPIKRTAKKMYPNMFTTEEINAAIEHCCTKAGQSRQRKDFYKCVFDRLFKNLSAKRATPQ